MGTAPPDRRSCSQQVARRTFDGRLGRAVPVGPYENVTPAARERRSRTETQPDDPSRLRRPTAGTAFPPGSSLALPVARNRRPRRDERIADVRSRPPQQRGRLLDPGQKLRLRRVHVGFDLDVGREHGVVDVVELECLGLDDDLARPPVGQRQIRRVAAHPDPTSGARNGARVPSNSSAILRLSRGANSPSK